MLKRLGPALAGLVVVAVLAIAVPTATSHPEECSGAAAWSQNMGTAYSPYLTWAGAEESACVSRSVTSRYDDSDARLAAGETGSKNLRLLASRDKAGNWAGDNNAVNSDLAFEDGYAYQGNYNGFAIWDVRDPSNPTLASRTVCPGSQNDVTVNDGILITSTDSRRTNDTCSSSSVPSPTAANPEPAGVWEGLKIWDVRDVSKPVLLGRVQTDCGSHTHTVIPEATRLIVYVQSYDVGAGRTRCGTEMGANSHDKISVVEVPRSDPAAAKVLSTPVLFPDGGGDAVTGTRRATTGCHDITVYPEVELAAGACTGQGSIIDISDPEKPHVISSVEDENFAFWHSATFSNDGKRVLFTDELGGGTQPMCNDTIGPKRGADAIYDISDPEHPKLMSYFKIPRAQSNTENCVAHNGNLIPVEGRDILVQSWYQGGISIVDWTDGANPKELAWFDRGPYASTLVTAGFWSSYYYNGFIYGSEIGRGFDVFKATGKEFSAAGGSRNGTLNAQTQYRF